MALTDNLVSYWKMDEASGDAVDAHGSNTLADNNTVGSGTGKINNARDFESGSNEYFSIADNADLSTGDIDFTIQVWVNLESKGFNPIVAKWGGTSQEYLLWYRSDQDKFELLVTHDGSTSAFVRAATFGAPSTGTWYCVHAWHDATGNQLGIAVNAGSADTQSHSAGVVNGAEGFKIGNDGFGNDFDGLIDEVGFWKRVLTSDERTELYNGGSGLAYSSFGGGGGGTNRRRRLLLCGVAA